MMNVDYLRAFVEVVSSGSISAASRKLNLSQPTITYQIKVLETLLDIQLVDRSNKGVRPTSAGEIVYRYGKHMTDLLRNLEAELSQLKNGVAGLTTICSTTAIGSYSLPCSVYLFKERYPAVEVKVKVSNWEEVVRQLETKTAELGVIEGRSPLAQYSACRLGRIEVVPVVGPKHHLFECKKELDPDNLLRETLIIREKGSSTRDLVEAKLEEVGVELGAFSRVVEMNSVDAVKATVEAGWGVGFVPEVAIKKELYTATLKPLAIKNLKLLQDVLLVYPKNRPLSRIGHLLLQFLKSPNRGFC